ncbi:MAG: tetratricopeptide repeat protein [Candidatus Sulfotelmatobacter sp.]
MKGRMFVIFLLLAGSVAAQPDAGSIIRRVRVRVAFGSGGCDAPAHVSLVGHSGPVAEGTTNDRCEVDFFNLPEATYHLIVSAGSFANADLGSINLTSGGPAEFEVQVKRPNELDRTYAVPGNAFVSASDLGVPSRARKEFDKANELIGKQDLGQAIQKLNKAISIYPAYAVAYNNLGVIYSRLEDPVREREALQKAISLNDHFALAYVNLGRMNIAAGDFPGAETALDKASTLDPADPMALILLSWSEFMQRRFEQAIATSRKAHALDKPHAFVHRVAARAFEQQRQGARAIAELELFLKEEPAGPRADAARKELETVKAVLP